MRPTFRPECPADYEAVRRLHQQAFDGAAEAALVNALRTEGYARVSLVAEIEGRVVAHILFSDVNIVTPQGTAAALALAPLAVLPEWQRQGLGTELTRHALEVGRNAGHAIVLVVGHPAYYPRFGFSAELARPLESPYAGPAFMALELVHGALAGVHGRVEYAPPFARL